MDYDIQQDRFYSPRLVLNFFARLRKIYGLVNIYEPEFRRAREMLSAAISLLGAYELNSFNQSWLQSNNQTSSPDVIAIQLMEAPNKYVTALISQIEVVDMEEHFKGEDIFEFLMKTKLSPKKAYDEHIIIVVHLVKNMKFNILEIAEKLKEVKPKSTIYFIGKVGAGASDKFMICSPYPRVTKIINFGLIETMKKYQIKENVKFSKGSNKEILMIKEEKIILKPADMFAFDEKKVEKYKIAKSQA